MSDLWDWCEDDDIWWDVDSVKWRLKELRVQNTRKDIQQWMNTCLWRAAWDGQFAVCECLVGQGGDPTWRCVWDKDLLTLECDGWDGCTAIHMAAMCNHSRVIQLFMNGGWCSRSDVTDIFELTSLWWAGYYGHKDCVEILLSRGADPLYERTQSDNNYLFGFKNGVSCVDSPLAVATKCHHGDIVAMMQNIIKARCSVASAGVCQGCQQLTSEIRSLSAGMAEKDGQIHSLETTVNDMKEEITENGRQISFLSKVCGDMKTVYGEKNKQLCDTVPLTGTPFSCVTEFSGSSLSASELQSSVTEVQILEVAKAAGDKWRDIGVYLGFKFTDMKDYEVKHRDSLSERLVEVLTDWRKKERNATVGILLSACKKAGVEGAATNALRQ